MIRINLLPVKELKAEVSRRREVVFGGICLGLTLATIAGVYGIQYGRIAGLQDELEGLRAELASLNLKAKSVGDLQAKIKEVKSKHEIIEDINRKKSGPVRVMQSLSAATPRALWLTQFKETGGNLTITGVATDNQTIAEFLKALGSHAYFRNTELVETTQADQAGAASKRFSIKSRLFYQPALAQADANATQPKATVAKNN
jgi:type IV pilus assembly protein PilN